MLTIHPQESTQKIPKILILSGPDGSLSANSQEQLAAIRARGNCHVDILYDNLSTDEIADRVKNQKYDIVLIDKNFTSSAYQIIDHFKNLSENYYGHKFYLDGPVESIIDRECKHTHFSGTVAIINHKNSSEIIKSNQDANRLTNTPNTAATHQNIGSIGKIFTSIAIAKLIVENKLDYDRPIRDSLSEIKNCPPYHKQIFESFSFTPRQLLTHTAGLNDIAGNIFEDSLGPDMLFFKRVEDFFRKFSSMQNQEKAMQVTPNNPAQQQYSNLGYDLLGLAIEAITGNYYNYIKENIFTPAAMLNVSTTRQSGSEFAIPYSDSPEKPLPTEIPEWLKNLAENKESSYSELANKALKWFEYTREKTALVERLNNNLTKEYETMLSTMKQDELPDFKERFTQKLQLAFSEIHKFDAENHNPEIIKAIEAVGAPFNEILTENKRRNVAYNQELDLLDDLLFNMHSNLSMQTNCLNRFLNDLGTCHPAGCWRANMKDMIAFDKALNDGPLAQYVAHLTMNQVITHGREMTTAYANGCFIIGNPSDENYHIGHTGSAPGAKAAYWMYPNRGYSILSQANDDKSQLQLASLLEKNLILGTVHGVHYFDDRVNPSAHAALMRDIDALLPPPPKNSYLGIYQQLQIDINSVHEDFAAENAKKPCVNEEIQMRDTSHTQALSPTEQHGPDDDCFSMPAPF